jgi:hypothetical protein
MNKQGYRGWEEELRLLVKRITLFLNWHSTMESGIGIVTNVYCKL